MSTDDAYQNRRSELLYLARKTRLQWISAAEHAGVGRPAGGSGQRQLQSKEMESLMSAMPAMKCLEEALTFLTDLSCDTEAVELASLVGAHLLPDDEDEGDLPDFAGMDAYAAFIAKLKRRSSTDLVKSLQAFVQGVEGGLREAALAGTLQDKLVSVSESIWIFLKKTLALIREHVCWEGQSAEQLASTRESLEIFLFSQLHRSLFVEDTAADSELRERIETLSFLSPEHLDIRSIIGDGVKVLSRPVEILRKSLPAAGSPIAKVQCLRECSAAISRSLSECKKDGSFAGADEFLPVLILTIKEANPAQLKSNINYILQFTDPAKLASEAGYLLTQFVSAVQFLETVDASALTISPLEFEVAVARCRANARKMSSDFSARAAKPAAPGVDAAARQAPVIAAKPKASTTTAMEILLQRRKYAALHLAPEQGWLTNLSSKNNNSNSNPQVHDGNARLAEESRLALVRALETYDTSIHGAVLSAWNGRGSSAGHASAAMPILSYVSSPVETLGVSDVPKLLAEYKALAKICSVLVMEKLNGAGTFSSDYGRSSN